MERIIYDNINEVPCDALLRYIKSMDFYDQLSIYREMQIEVYDGTDCIEDMESFDDNFHDITPYDIARMAFYGQDEDDKNSSFNPSRDYYTFNENGNLKSLSKYGAKKEIEEQFDFWLTGAYNERDAIQEMILERYSEDDVLDLINEIEFKDA